MSYSENEYHERFLIQVPPKASLKFSFANLLQAEAVEFYSMTDFKLQSYLLDEMQTRLEQSEIAVSLPTMEDLLKAPDPEDLCEFRRIGAMCVTHWVRVPHCVRIENQANGQGVVASMRVWYTCLEGRNGPWHQQAELFYPTRDDLFHRAMVGDPQFTGPQCNVSQPHDYNNSIAYTEPVNDTTKKHKWNRVMGFAFDNFDFGLPTVDCIAGSCQGGSWLYEKAGPGCH